jgi:hypothetical protein
VGSPKFIRKSIDETIDDALDEEEGEGEKVPEWNLKYLYDGGCTVCLSLVCSRLASILGVLSVGEGEIGVREKQSVCAGVGVLRGEGAVEHKVHPTQDFEIICLFCPHSMRRWCVGKRSAQQVCFSFIFLRCGKVGL